MLNVIFEDLEYLLEGKTGEKLKEQLRGVKEFEHLSHNKWMKFGEFMKKNKLTKTVFTKAFANFLRYLRFGGELPVTKDNFSFFLKKTNWRPTGWVKNTAYDIFDAMFGVMFSDGLLKVKQIEKDNQGNPIFGYVKTRKLSKVFNFLKKELGINLNKYKI